MKDQHYAGMQFPFKRTTDNFKFITEEEILTKNTRAELMALESETGGRVYVATIDGTIATVFWTNNNKNIPNHEKGLNKVRVALVG